MVQFLKSFAKINITLRVTKLRDDGYHDLCSLFWRLDRGEMLAVSDSPDTLDHVSAVGAKIAGENIVSKAMKVSRAEGLEVPLLDVKIHKTIPPGMGMGGGSGNADAILNFIFSKNQARLSTDVIAKKIGADVPFFVSDCEAAIVSGIGDTIEPVPRPDLKIVVSLPKISSPTGHAYTMLDEYYRRGYPLDEARAREEIAEISSRLAANEQVGMLPNDFAPLLIEKHEIYQNFFDEMREKNALAWGITGSGSAMFAILQHAQ